MTPMLIETSPACQIGTTNHLDRLDPALSSRPSRFDRKYDFPNPSLAERHQYAVYWQRKLASNTAIKFPDSLLDEFARKTDRFSFAFMNEALCVVESRPYERD